MYTTSNTHISVSLYNRGIHLKHAVMSVVGQPAPPVPPSLILLLLGDGGRDDDGDGCCIEGVEVVLSVELEAVTAVL